MRIMHCTGNNKVDIRETAKPEMDDKHVILKVMASALCGTELGSFKNGLSDGPYNTGHEVVGIIESAPSGSEYKPGMRAGACVVQGCGTCEYCLAGRETACGNKSFFAVNAHAEYFKLGLNGVRILPDDIDWPEAVVLSGDGLGVPARAARRLGDTSGAQILVVGLGPVGQGNVLVQAFNDARVMGVDLCEYRTALALANGAEKVVNPASADLKQAVMDWTGNKGVDIVILAVGKAEVLRSVVELVKHQGTIFQVAEFTQAEINPSAMFVQKELTMTGSWYYTSKDWKLMQDYYSRGLPINKLITHVVPFDEAQKAIDSFVSGNSGKVLLKYY